jgi:hypothetical protein
MFAFVKAAKQQTGFAYTQSTARRLWQPSYWDRILRDQESTWDVIRYMCENPIRAALVERVEDYDFVGSQLMAREELIRELTLRPVAVWRP